MAQQKGNNLDSLMMAYADLSGGNRGSSFKGPPLKEVKNDKPAAPAFKPSSKARDWSSLEQALEDAFVISPSPAAPKVELQPNPTMSAFSQWQPQPGPVQPTSLPARQVSTDDWGDFQDFQSPTEASKPIVEPHHLKPVAEDDDFADFVTASGPPATQPGHHELSRAQPSSLGLVQPLPTQPFGGPPNLVINSSQGVGLRLASFQEESPVHNFRVGTTTAKFEPPSLSVSESPSRFEAFFGGTDDESFPAPKTDTFQPTLPSASSFPVFDAVMPTLDASDAPLPDLGSLSSIPIINPGASTTSMSSQASSSGLPTPMALSNDKYSALADLLSLSDQDVSAFSAPRPSFPLPGTGFSSGIDENRPPQTFQTSLLSGGVTNSNAPVFQTNFSLPASTQACEEEDFGDFITVPTGPSKPEPFNKPPEQPLRVFTSSRANVPIMTWHECRFARIAFFGFLSFSFK